VDPRQELAIVRRSWKIVLLVGVLAAVVAFVASNSMSRTYESSTRLIVGQALQASNPDVNLFQTATRARPDLRVRRRDAPAPREGQDVTQAGRADPRR
jgi:uncharacterized protein involved in exopolysaccharide biosynthesis